MVKSYCVKQKKQTDWLFTIYKKNPEISVGM